MCVISTRSNTYRDNVASQVFWPCREVRESEKGHGAPSCQGWKLCANGGYLFTLPVDAETNESLAPRKEPLRAQRDTLSELATTDKDEVPPREKHCHWYILHHHVADLGSRGIPTSFLGCQSEDVLAVIR